MEQSVVAVIQQRLLEGDIPGAAAVMAPFISHARSSPLAVFNLCRDVFARRPDATRLFARLCRFMAAVDKKQAVHYEESLARFALEAYETREAHDHLRTLVTRDPYRSLPVFRGLAGVAALRVEKAPLPAGADARRRARVVGEAVGHLEFAVAGGVMEADVVAALLEASYERGGLFAAVTRSTEHTVDLQALASVRDFWLGIVGRDGDDVVDARRACVDTCACLISAAPADVCSIATLVQQCEAGGLPVPLAPAKFAQSLTEALGTLECVVPDAIHVTRIGDMLWLALLSVWGNPEVQAECLHAVQDLLADGAPPPPDGCNFPVAPVPIPQAPGVAV